MHKENQGTVLHQLRYDVHHGTRNNWLQYVGFIFVFILIHSFFLTHWQTLFSHGVANASPSCWDYILDFFKGIQKVSFTDRRERFDLPIPFLLFNLSLTFTIGKYACCDLEGIGLLTLLQSKKRSVWWNGKCLWCVFHVLCVYALLFLTSFCFSALNGNSSMEFTPQLNQVLSQIPTQTFEKWTLLQATFFLPILVSIALAFLQLSLSLWIPPVFSLLIIICLLVVSGYFCNPFLIGNYFMLLRSDLVLKGGVSLQTGYLVSIGLLFLSFFCGKIYFCKMDFLSRSEIYEN
jgi:hypothetical protein